MTDPELDLLRELLEEDPGARAFRDVGRELVRREAWPDAVVVLEGAAPYHEGDRELFGLLAQAYVSTNRPIDALSSLKRISFTPERHPVLARLEVIARAAIGDVERAEMLAETLILLHPDLGPIEKLLSAVPSTAEVQVEVRLIDPMLTRERAEEYVGVGRVDRAVRVYRRMLFHRPNDKAARSRLSDLLGRPHDLTVDDLSEELPDPSEFPPPDLKMPSPYEAGVNDELPTDPGVRAGDEEVTDVGSVPGSSGRKRRSLLSRRGTS